MTKRIQLEPRKEPRQMRSRRMREYILEAAIRVLRREGALRFTTWRVAEAAGVSVGSLYQYFPNKQAIIFAIHSTRVERTWIDVQRILDNRRSSAREKVRRLTRLFFLIESEESAQMGAALQEAEGYFAEQPEQRRMMEQVLLRLQRFVREALPPTTPAERVAFSAQLLATSIETFGKTLAGFRLSQRALLHWARACAEITATYIGIP